MAVLIVKGQLVQPGVSQDAVFEIDTGLGVLDQKTLWEIIAFEALWKSVGSVSGTEQWYMVQAALTRKPEKIDYLDSEVISAIRWTANGGSGAAGDLIPFESLKRDLLIDKPWVANSKIYVVLTGWVANVQTIQFKIAYEEKKVSEVEFLKAQSGYCIC
jgi:hypothetical protein